MRRVADKQPKNPQLPRLVYPELHVALGLYLQPTEAERLVEACRHEILEILSRHRANERLMYQFALSLLPRSMHCTCEPGIRDVLVNHQAEHFTGRQIGIREQLAEEYAGHPELKPYVGSKILQKEIDELASHHAHKEEPGNMFMRFAESASIPALLAKMRLRHALLDYAHGLLSADVYVYRHEGGSSPMKFIKVTKDGMPKLKNAALAAALSANFPSLQEPANITVRYLNNGNPFRIELDRILHELWESDQGIRVKFVGSL